MARNFRGSIDRNAVALMFGVMTILCLYLASLVPDIAKLPMLLVAGLFLSGVMAEDELVRAIISFVVCTIAGFLLTSGFNLLAFYIFFCGWYAIAKFAFDGMADQLAAWCAKFALYNIALALTTWLAPDPLLTPYFELLPVYILVPLAQVVLLIYDGAIWVFAMLYRAVIRRYL